MLLPRWTSHASWKLSATASLSSRLLSPSSYFLILGGDYNVTNGQGQSSQFIFNSSVVTIKEMSFQGSSDTREKNPFPLIPCHANSGGTSFAFCLELRQAKSRTNNGVYSHEVGSSSPNEHLRGHNEGHPLPHGSHVPPQKLGFIHADTTSPYLELLFFPRKSQLSFLPSTSQLQTNALLNQDFLKKLWTIHELRTRCHVIPTN